MLLFPVRCFYNLEQVRTKWEGFKGKLWWPEGQNTTTFQKTRRYFRKHDDISENVTFQKTQTFQKKLHFQKTRHFRKHDISEYTTFQKTRLSENMMTFQKTRQHFRKHDDISENTTFQKTRRHFRKHNNISKNTTTFQKTQRHFRKRHESETSQPEPITAPMDVITLLVAVSLHIKILWSVGMKEH